jgi:hypothetical protein
MSGCDLFSQLPKEPPKRAAPRAPQPANGDPRNHFCRCGKWGAFGLGGPWRMGKDYDWACAEHRGELGAVR